MIGQVLLEQFRVEMFIAAGGMGSVYKVWDLKRSTWLAMKALHAEFADDPDSFRRFQREANALKKLAHPNIVPFYGLYRTDDFAFLLQRYIDGPSLGSLLKARKGAPLPLEDALIYLRAISSALGYAHHNDVVHCDVKPGNVLMDAGGGIYLTDFGIRAPRRQHQHHLRRGGHTRLYVAGTGARRGAQPRFRCVRPGGDGLRDAHRAAAVSRR